MQFSFCFFFVENDKKSFAGFLVDDDDLWRIPFVADLAAHDDNVPCHCHTRMIQIMPKWVVSRWDRGQFDCFHWYPPIT